MRKISIISSSVRDGRLSHRVALFLKEYLERVHSVQIEILDLKEYDFPLFNERFIYQAQPTSKTEDYVKRITASEGIVIVSPVYNASFPAALKNAIDLLVAEWVRKPVAVVTVTAGNVPPIAPLQHLQALMLKLGARVAAPMYMVTGVEKEFSESGLPTDPATAEKRARPLIEELLWLVEKTIQK